MSCQLKYIDELKKENSLFGEFWQNFINFIRPLKGYAIALKRKISRKILRDKEFSPGKLSEFHEIKENDIVIIRSKNEISGIINEWRKHKGCAFMDQMYDYCGKSYKVLKRVDHFYDEAKKKFVKCKDIVILDSVTCNGKRTLIKEKCDRNCFLFWHKDWIKKIEQPDR